MKKNNQYLQEKVTKISGCQDILNFKLSALFCDIIRLFIFNTTHLVTNQQLFKGISNKVMLCNEL